MLIFCQDLNGNTSHIPIYIHFVVFFPSPAPCCGIRNDCISKILNGAKTQFNPIRPICKKKFQMARLHFIYEDYVSTEHDALLLWFCSRMKSGNSSNEVPRKEAIQKDRKDIGTSWKGVKREAFGKLKRGRSYFIDEDYVSTEHDVLLL